MLLKHLLCLSHFKHIYHWRSTIAFIFFLHMLIQVMISRMLRRIPCSVCSYVLGSILFFGGGILDKEQSIMVAEVQTIWSAKSLQ